jgi:hypothetical protein
VFICIIAQVHIYLDIYFALSEVAFLTSSFIGLRQIMINVKINREISLSAAASPIVKRPNAV